MTSGLDQQEYPTSQSFYDADGQTDGTSLE